MHERVGRRDALLGIGTVTVGAAVGIPAVVRAASPASAVEAEAGASAPPPGSPAFGGLSAAGAEDDVRALFGPLREGEPISTHWRLDAVYSVRAGAIPVSMSTLRALGEVTRRSAADPSPLAALLRPQILEVSSVGAPCERGASAPERDRVISPRALTGERFAVEIFRRGADGPPPVATAGSLALYLVNRGDGGSPTPELAGLGVMALARALEARLAAGAPIPPGLVTHRRRSTWEPEGFFDVPLR